MIKHAMADANSHMEVNMDITSMTGPDIGQPRGLAIPEMSLRQSVQVRGKHHRMIAATAPATGTAHAHGRPCPLPPV